MNTALLALIRNDLRLFLSDRRVVIISLLVPIGIASFFGMIQSGGSGSGGSGTIQLMITDNDQSATSKEIVQNLQKEKSLAVTLVSEDTARTAIAQGKVPVALVLPKGMESEASTSLFGGAAAQRPQAQLLYDPAHGSEFQMVRGLAMQQIMQTVSRHAFSPNQNQGNWETQIAAAKASDTLKSEDKSALVTMLSSIKSWYARPEAASNGGAMTNGLQMPVEITDTPVSKNDEANKMAPIAHSFIGMMVQGVLFFGIDAAMGILRDRRNGIWKRLRAAPVSRFALLGGKMIATAIVASFILTLVFLAGALLYHLRILGSIGGFALIVGATAWMVAGFGLLVAALGKTEQQSRGFAVPAVLTMTILGGAWFPSFLMPHWVQSVSLAVPTRHAIDALDGVVWRGLGFGSTLFPALILIGFGCAFALVAALRFPWEAE